MEKIVVKEEIGQRLDVFLSKKLDISRSSVKKMIDDGNVIVNKKSVKAGYSICLDDEIEYQLEEKPVLTAEPEDIALDVVYEDDDLLVINKPQGMCVHPAVGNYSGTLVNALTFRCKNLSSVNGEFRPGIVHRLDKDTSGLLIVAKNNKAHENLAKQISTKECKRHYMAVLEGNLKQENGIVATHIVRSKKNRQMMEVCDDTKGKYAETHFDVVAHLNGYTLVHFELKTGRTHQIRVHAKYLGHPVVGDRVYGFGEREKELAGQLLTAYKICFTQPTTKIPLQFEVPLPEYFSNFVKKHSDTL